MTGVRVLGLWSSRGAEILQGEIIPSSVGLSYIWKLNCRTGIVFEPCISESFPQLVMSLPPNFLPGGRELRRHGSGMLSNKAKGRAVPTHERAKGPVSLPHRKNGVESHESLTLDPGLSSQSYAISPQVSCALGR